MKEKVNVTGVPETGTDFVCKSKRNKKAKCKDQR